MNNLAKRSITGLLLVIAITAAVSWEAGSFICLLAVINLLSLLEFYRLFHTDNISPRKIPGAVCSLSLLVTCFLVVAQDSNWKILLINIPALSGIFMIELYGKSEKPFYNLALTFLGIFCITIPLCFFIAIAFFPFPNASYHPSVILGYFIILWTGDSAAYFAGRLLGTHPLFKRISPKKTWEGSLGGAIAALAVAYWIPHVLPVPNPGGWMIMALIINITGAFGDLIKSLLKRSLNLKDSGNILPGHGGMLDRFDSLLGSAPFAFLYLVLFRPV